MVVVPTVTVMDQELMSNTVAIAEVVSEGAGWLVIHAQADGRPGPILGYTPVADGSNANVMVEIDPTGATETLYAMLHTDGGAMGTWEFPGGPDTPVSVDGMVVTPPFMVTGLPAAAPTPVPPITPSVTVTDQEIVNGTVTVAEVVSDGTGWMVIHADAGGEPGQGVGVSPVADGVNTNVVVEIDLTEATETLYAMLHTDAGGVDTMGMGYDPEDPLRSEGQVMTVPFKVLASNEAAIEDVTVLAASGEAEIEIEDFKFGPSTLTIRVGTTVKWSNKDEAPHTATSDTGVWDSGTLVKGDDFFFTFNEPGVFPYYCIPHGAPGGVGMSATIIVIQ
jgi:plastocyanin